MLIHILDNYAPDEFNTNSQQQGMKKRKFSGDTTCISNKRTTEDGFHVRTTQTCVPPSNEDVDLLNCLVSLSSKQASSGSDSDMPPVHADLHSLSSSPEMFPRHARDHEEVDSEENEEEDLEDEDYDEDELPAVDMKDVITKLKQHPSSWPFRIPVDASNVYTSNYYEVIKEPMDLSTMENKFNQGLYEENLGDFVNDFFLMMKNCQTFYCPESDPVRMSLQLSTYFQELVHFAEGVEWIENDILRRGRRKIEWTTQEDEKLQKLVTKYGRRWTTIVKHFKDKTIASCRTRASILNFDGCKKSKMEKMRRLWSPKEDTQLNELVNKHGANNWKLIASKMSGYNRNPTQCRQRWNDHLSNSMQHSGWTAEEDQKIVDGYKMYGNSWTKIAMMVPGRGYHAVRNRLRSTKIRAQLGKLRKDLDL